MTSFLKSVAIWVLAAVLAAPPAFAQERGADYGQEELDRLLAPIALYPDSLLSQVLMASTYPLEVVEAARWSRANPRLKGEEAVNAVEAMDWDPSVKSLVAFPQILHRMDERLDWTQRLGEAFLAQEPQVLDAIQGLRQRAAAAGNLDSNEHMRVTRQDDAILIEPARPEAVYVPYYSPAVVYGPWWYPAYPPVYWGPFPGYYAAPVFSPAFFWGPAIVVSTGFFFGHTNWHHRHVTVVHKQVVHTTRFGKPHTVVTSDRKPVAWTHDPVHRKGVPYRHASLRDQYGRPGMRGGDGRRDYRGPGSAPNARHEKGGHPGGTRDGRSDDRRDFSDRGGREAAPQRPSAQGGTNAPGKPSFDSGSRRPGSASPSAPGSDRSSEGRRDNDRFQERGFASRNTPVPATREARRPGPSANNVLRFPGRMAQPAAPAPATRREQPVSNGHNIARLQARMAQPASAPTVRRQPPASNGNDVLRFQGRGPVSRPAPSAPVVRQAQRPPAAVQHGTRQPAAVPRQPLRFQASRPVMAPRASAPAPQARAASGARGWRGGSLR